MFLAIEGVSDALNGYGLVGAQRFIVSVDSEIHISSFRRVNLGHSTGGLKPGQPEWQHAQQLVCSDRAPIDVPLHMLVPSDARFLVEREPTCSVEAEISPAHREVVIGNDRDIYIRAGVEGLEVFGRVQTAPYGSASDDGQAGWVHVNRCSERAFPRNIPGPVT